MEAAKDVSDDEADQTRHFLGELNARRHVPNDRTGSRPPPAFKLPGQTSSNVAPQPFAVFTGGDAPVAREALTPAAHSSAKVLDVKENVMEPKPWNDPLYGGGSRSASSAKPTHRTPSFPVFADSQPRAQHQPDSQQSQRTARSALQSLPSTAGGDHPLSEIVHPTRCIVDNGQYYEMQNGVKMRLMYNKTKTDCGMDEFSFEELRAIRFRSVVLSLAVSPYAQREIQGAGRRLRQTRESSASGR